MKRKHPALILRSARPKQGFTLHAAQLSSLPRGG